MNLIQSEVTATVRKQPPGQNLKDEPCGGLGMRAREVRREENLWGALEQVQGLKNASVAGVQQAKGKVVE